MGNENRSNYKYAHKSDSAVVIITACSEEQSNEILKNVVTNPNSWRLDEIDDLEQE